MRFITLIAAAIAVLSPFGESLYAQPTERAPNATDSKQRKQGPWEKFHPATGKVAYRATFKDDVPVGTTERFYEDGSLQSVMVHTGKGRDRAKLYHPNGKLMAMGVYVNQQRDSVWQFYDENGQLRSEETYAAGVKNGRLVLYSATGSVLERANFNNNFRDGLWEQFYDDGKPRLICTVVNGLYYEGKYTEYFPDGKKRLEGNYVDGKRHSSWYEFNSDGSIRTIYVYREGKIEEEHRKNGTFEMYYPNDILRSVHTWKDGKLHGPFTEYYEQGQWKEVDTKDEFGNPMRVQRLSGTQALREGRYLEGELHGEVIYYHTNGKVSKKEQYERGKLLK
jgi:antitoxin component YwqK of YwqJK toxin-antitoxin module